ncbi:MAG: hypothetical protein O2845_06425 [Proteobacteria bacterium]|nr:hypothetical protein [Pseudomonadota bacterium]
MKHHRLYPRHATPAGMVVRVGDRYINAQGIKLRVARIFSLSADADVWVEFQPLETAFAGKCWQAELVMHCADADARIRSGEGSARPCVYIEDLDHIRRADELIVAAA